MPLARGCHCEVNRLSSLWREFVNDFWRVNFFDELAGQRSWHAQKAHLHGAIPRVSSPDIVTSHRDVFGCGASGVADTVVRLRQRLSTYVPAAVSLRRGQFMRGALVVVAWGSVA
jgi:hypothetical protein